MFIYFNVVLISLNCIFIKNYGFDFRMYCIYWNIRLFYVEAWNRAQYL